MAKSRSIPNDITSYVSNTNRDIYTVSNVSEEVIAVIFAYVSRSPRSFRDNIMTVIREEHLGRKRASEFHEKWVLNYGHASVAEHATVHVGIERVSRLFSSLLELSNEHLSFTEYSQRYQKPKKGSFFVPVELSEYPALRNEYIELNNLQYDIYEKLNDKLFSYLRETSPTPKGVEERVHLRALEKLAFEDARYALSLSTLTNLGMTANARAIEDCLTKLLSSSYPEARERAGEIKEEVRFSIPTLVKYASESPYITETRNALKELSDAVAQSLAPLGGGACNLLDWTGKGSSDPEMVAIEKMAQAILFEHSQLGYEAIAKDINESSSEEKLEIFKKSIEKLGRFDNPINPFKLIRYEAEFVISEANWHQLLRHRKADWIFQEPSVYNGWTIPPNVENSGSEDLLMRATEASHKLYEKLANENLGRVASYVVTNAHNRRVIGSFDLWEVYHLINLRLSEGAQWDIKSVIEVLADKISRYHPNLLAPALGRVKA